MRGVSYTERVGIRSRRSSLISESWRPPGPNWLRTRVRTEARIKREGQALNLRQRETRLGDRVLNLAPCGRSRCGNSESRSSWDGPFC